MTVAEFEKLFWSTVESLPRDMVDCIKRYAAARITPEIHVTDSAVDQIQQRQGLDFVPAAMVEANGKWFFAFRPMLLSAPESVFQTIIRHEVLHAFLYAVNGMPTPGAEERYFDNEKRLEAEYARQGLKPACEADRIENLICLMNDEFGGDETAAREWVIVRRLANSPPR